MRSEVGIGPKSLCYGFLNEIMAHPCPNGGPGITMLGCTKFNEGCTKDPKIRYEVGIGPKSLFYGFLNAIMTHPCSDGGPGSTTLRCTKFNEWCTKFCEGCTKGRKMRFEVGISPKSLCYGFLNEIMTHPCFDGVPGSTRFGCNKFLEIISHWYILNKIWYILH